LFLPIIVAVALNAGCKDPKSSDQPDLHSSAADAAPADKGSLEASTVADVAASVDGAIPAQVSAVEQQRYESDLKFISQPRPPGSAHWKKVQDLCHDRFKQLGYTVQLHKYATGINVVGTLSGTTEPKKQVMVSAHYDHIPNCAGADDNGTGVAGLLETARVLANTAKYRRTLVVSCWDEEEKGLIGSRAYSQEAKKRGDDIVTVFVYEMIGYKSDKPNSQQIPTGKG